MKRNKFSLSNYRLMMGDMGYLLPCGLLEVLPGDTFQHATSVLVRMSPLARPVMHPLHVRIHHFYVPNRILWDEWEDFITGGPDGMDASVYPTISLNNTTGGQGTLPNLLGVPIIGASARQVSALPIRAYQLIWQEYFRDQDLSTAPTISLAGGADTTTTKTLQKVAWEKDRYTSARPWTQKGPQITLPLGTSAPVTANANVQVNQPAPNHYFDNSAAATVNVTIDAPGGGAPGTGIEHYITPAEIAARLSTDLSGASAVDVNDVRRALALERYQEARARYGSRFTEYLRYLGIKSSDARLQRPEYLGGGKQTIQFSEVLQTGVTTDGDDLGIGNLRGHGIGALRSNRYRRFFEEHGWVISLISVRPKTVYSQSLQQKWNRRTKEDHWQLELQHIGQEEVLNKEVYVNHATPDGVFGYNDRYGTYRREESQVTGAFLSSSYQEWHMARIFGSTPALNASFVEADPTTRIFQQSLTAQNQMQMMVSHNVQARRLVSREGTSFIF